MAAHEPFHFAGLVDGFSELVAPQHPDDPQADEWGLRKARVDYGADAYDETTHHPLAHVTSVSEVHAFRWPSPDNYDYSTVTTGIAQNNRYRLVRAGVYELFLLYCSLRGMEQAFEDLLVNPDIADAILGHVFDFYYEHNRRIWEAGRGQIDIMYLAEDLGGQTGPLFSLEIYRRFLLPNQKKMADLARSFGLKVFYHTDGAARVFLPDLIDVVGIDVLNPIQWRCPGMEREGLARDFGSRVIFHGAIDNQYTLPFGTPDEVRREVRETREIFRNCRWVCASCHNIQAVRPVENIIAMYEAAHKSGNQG